MSRELVRRQPGTVQHELTLAPAQEHEDTGHRQVSSTVRAGIASLEPYVQGA